MWNGKRLLVDYDEFVLALGSPVTSCEPIPILFPGVNEIRCLASRSPGELVSIPTLPISRQSSRVASLYNE